MSTLGCKKIEKAIKAGNCVKVIKLCKKYNFGVEVSEELLLRAIFIKHNFVNQIQELQG